MSREPWALLAPGQGSQIAELTAVVDEHAHVLRALAAERAGADVMDCAAQGTRYAQAAIFLATIARWRAIGAPRATAVAGHSLGEYAALVLAERLSAEAALGLVLERGRLMEKAIDRAAPGGMLALLDWPATDLTELTEQHSVSVANRNSLREVVVSGPLEQLSRFRAEGETRGLRAIPLRVHGAFHSEAMQPVIAPLRARLEGAAFTPGRCLVLSGLDALPLTDPPRQLAEACLRPVAWHAVIAQLERIGVRRILDLDPHGVLARLVQFSAPNIWTERLDDSGARVAVVAAE